MRQINENTVVENITCIIYIKWMSSIKVANQNYPWLPFTTFTKNGMINQLNEIHVTDSVFNKNKHYIFVQ